MKKYLKDLVPLVAICLVAALLLAVFNMITEGPIAENTARAAQETRMRLLASAATFEPVELEEGSAMDSCYVGLDANGEPVGHVVETTVGGYGGEIVVTVGVDTENVITGINVGGENFSETAGLGALAKEASFTDQFIGEKAPLTLAKGTTGTQDGIIDAISGATITSTAVNGGVNSAAKFIMDMSGGAASPNTASVQGFAGPVAVTLFFYYDWAITEINIGDAFFNETEGYGKKALEESFQAQFIGKVPPLALTDIDAIAGATITSTAVVDAVNQVQAQLSGAAPVAAPAVEETAPVPAAGENALTASAKGFAGPVAVAVDLDENNAITAITIGDDSFAETPGFGAKALEDAFKAQFIGKTLPIAAADVDGIAGATITTTAVIDALNATIAPAGEEASAVEEPADLPMVSENALTASAKGFAGPVAVAVDVDENNTITAIKIGDDSFAETPGFGAKALEDAFQAQFIGKTLPIAAADVDGIAGATITTTAVIDALNATIAPEAVETAAVETDASAGATADAQAGSTAAVEEPAALPMVSENALTASAKGFAGPVAVAVDVNENNTITAIKIGDDSFAETPGFGAKALEDAFQAQFIGKTLPIATADVDGIAGATITTTAVIDALNATIAPEAVEAAAVETDAAAGATADAQAGSTADQVAPASAEVVSAVNRVEREIKKQEKVVEAIPAATEAPAVNRVEREVKRVAKEEAAAAVLTGSAKGFAGPVAVEITVADNAITAIKIGDESFAETPGFGAKALEDAFQAQFIGKVLPLSASDIDGIAGATVTTNAVIEAVNTAK